MHNAKEPYYFIILIFYQIFKFIVFFSVLVFVNSLFDSVQETKLSSIQEHVKIIVLC